jgi:hypothetical protein
MTSAALVGIDSCPIGFHQEKQRLYYERSSTWIQRNTVCPSWSHLDTEKQIQQTLSQEENRGYCYLEIVYNCFTFNYMSILGSKELLFEP